MKGLVDDVLKGLGVHDHLLEVAHALEDIALNDDYFVKRKLYPNVDYYSGILLRAIGIPTSMFTVMFAMSRTVGWVSHWNEMLFEGQLRIGRPRQLYAGVEQREYEDAETPPVTRTLSVQEKQIIASNCSFSEQRADLERLRGPSGTSFRGTVGSS